MVFAPAGPASFASTSGRFAGFASSCAAKPRFSKARCEERGVALDVGRVVGDVRDREQVEVFGEVLLRGVRDFVAPVMRGERGEGQETEQGEHQHSCHRETFERGSTCAPRMAPPFALTDAILREEIPPVALEKIPRAGVAGAIDAAGERGMSLALVVAQHEPAPES